MRLLLLSNSTSHGRRLLDHAGDEVRGFLDGVRRLLFVPFALHDRAGYVDKVRGRFADWSIEVEGLEAAAERGGAQIEAAEAVFVGGGNTFRLLKTLRENDLLAPLALRARAGMPYMGASAGTNLACPTIRTTNDMPIVEPQGFDALGLVPFQINPHYLDPDPDSKHMGETRERRIREFLEENDTPVVGLREGSWIAVAEGKARLGGIRPLRLFRRGAEPEERPPRDSLSDLLP